MPVAQRGPHLKISPILSIRLPNSATLEPRSERFGQQFETNEVRHESTQAEPLVRITFGAFQIVYLVILVPMTASNICAGVLM
jgi:hypothetical protein